LRVDARDVAAESLGGASRSDLLRDVFHYSPHSRTVSLRTHIGRLRRKLGDAGKLIVTVRKFGYRLAAEQAPTQV